MTQDVLIIGGGHNGLVCAFYLARAGLKVTVLERRHVVGGAAVTEEFHPGFRNSTAAYTVSLLNPKVIADLELHTHGLKIVHRKLANFIPVDDRSYLAVGAGRTQQEVAKFSARDAQAVNVYYDRIGALADVLRDMVLMSPPNVMESGWFGALPELLKSASLGSKLAGLSMQTRRDLLAIFTRSAGEYLDSWFESDPIKAILGFDGIVGNYASPYTPGTAYVLLHHLFGEVNGIRGEWGHAIGGMGAITQAMAKAAEAKGVTIRLNAGVKEVLVRDGKAVGVVTEAGERIEARIIASNTNPKLLYERLLDPAHLPDDFRERIRNYKCGSGTFRMNVALSELPKFTCLPTPGDHLTSGIVIGPSLKYLDQAYHDARAGGWSKEPIVEMLIPSTLDNSLAPEGKHVASLFCQHVAPELSGGRSWSDHRDEVAQVMINTVDRFAPGFRNSVIGYMAMTPMDLETTFGLIGGDIMHGALSLDQLFSARPVLGNGNYRAPIAGLYMCGAGTHPGGGVTGAPGHNAAREILRDLGKRFS
ncbi:MAG: NAD(P)/FAD-dependent oxidoreductase [Micropepsaceae bacterium]